MTIIYDEGFEEPAYKFQNTATGVFPVNTATGIFAPNTASTALVQASPSQEEERCDQVILSVLDPFSAIPKTPLFSHGQPAVVRKIISTKAFDITASSVMWVVWWYRSDQLVQGWVRATDQRYYPCADLALPPSVKLSDDYTQMALQSSGFSIKSATISGSTFAINGQVTSACMIDPPDFSTITDSTLLSYALGPNAAISQVPIANGAVSINPPSVLQDTLITPDNGSVLPQGNNFFINSTYNSGPSGGGWIARSSAESAVPLGTDVVVFDSTTGGFSFPPNQFGRIRLVGVSGIGVHNVPTTPVSGTAYNFIVRLNRRSATTSGAIVNTVQNFTQTRTVAPGEVTTSNYVYTCYDYFDILIPADPSSLIVSVQIIYNATAAGFDFFNQPVPPLLAPQGQSQIRMEFPELYGGGFNQYCTAHILSGVNPSTLLSVLVNKVDHYAVVPGSRLARNQATGGYWSYRVDQRMALESIFDSYAHVLRFCYDYATFQNLMMQSFFTGLACGGGAGGLVPVNTASSKLGRKLMKGLRSAGNFVRGAQALATNLSGNPFVALAANQIANATGMGNLATASFNC